MSVAVPTRAFGNQSMIAPMRRALVKRPDASFDVEDFEKWHYPARPNLSSAQEEHDLFVRILRENGIEVEYHSEFLPDHADAIFTYDSVLITDRGAVILNMSKELRRGEEEPMSRAVSALGIPIRYRLTGTARAEGGDLLWLDHDTLVVGQGFRTNPEGLASLRTALPELTLVPVDLPYGGGPDACLHLMSIVSLIDVDLAVAYLPFLPVQLWRLLEERGVEVIGVPEEEFLRTNGANVLALAPRKVLMLEGNMVTQRALEEKGCDVITFKGEQTCLLAEAGPVCLIRPLLRDY